MADRHAGFEIVRDFVIPACELQKPISDLLAVIRRKPARPVGCTRYIPPTPPLRTLPTQFESFYTPVENSVVS
jgi:hypothetical protein